MINSKKWGGKNLFSKVIYLVPALALMAIFFLGPVLLTVYYSFTNMAITGSAAANFQFVGLSNYIKMFSDKALLTSVLNTLVFLIGCLVGQTLFGFFLALLMKNKRKGFRRVVGAIVLAGWVMPEIVCAICMYSFFTGEGTLNVILGLFGVEEIAWLYEYPMLSVIIANVWHGTAFSMMVYQSALDDVPAEIEESARLDGANSVQNLFYIILPTIRNTIMTNTMLITLMTLGVFGLIFAMTSGGPGTATTTLPLFMYFRAFKNYDLGYGTAISMILLVLGVFFGVFYTRVASKEK